MKDDKKKQKGRWDGRQVGRQQETEGHWEVGKTGRLFDQLYYYSL